MKTYTGEEVSKILDITSQTLSKYKKDLKLDVEKDNRDLRRLVFTEVHLNLLREYKVKKEKNRVKFISKQSMKEPEVDIKETSTLRVAITERTNATTLRGHKVGSKKMMVIEVDPNDKTKKVNVLDDFYGEFEFVDFPERVRLLKVVKPIQNQGKNINTLIKSLKNTDWGEKKNKDKLPQLVKQIIKLQNETNDPEKKNRLDKEVGALITAITSVGYVQSDCASRLREILVNAGKTSEYESLRPIFTKIQEKCIRKGFDDIASFAAVKGNTLSTDWMYNQFKGILGIKDFLDPKMIDNVIDLILDTSARLIRAYISKIYNSSKDYPEKFFEVDPNKNILLGTERASLDEIAQYLLTEGKNRDCVSQDRINVINEFRGKILTRKSNNQNKSFNSPIYSSNPTLSPQLSLTISA